MIRFCNFFALLNLGETAEDISVLGSLNCALCSSSSAFSEKVSVANVGMLLVYNTMLVKVLQSMAINLY